MAAISTLVAWAIALLFVTGWLLLPARDGARTGPLLLLLLPHCTPGTGVALLLTLGILVLWTWKSQAQGLFADMSGRAWVAGGVPFLAHGLVLAAFVLFVHWSVAQGERDPRLVPLPAALPWLAGGAVALKALAAGSALSALRRSGVAPRALAGLVGLWLGVALALFGALCWLTSQKLGTSTPGGMIAATYLPIVSGLLPDALRSPLSLAAITVIFLPLTRLALAPLALAWNRHR